MSKAWVYILRCANDAYYTGYTTNLEQRLAQHQAGEVNWTRPRRRVSLVYSQEMPDEH